MSYTSYTNTEDVIPIDKIEFTIFGNQEIKKYSVVNKDPFGINLPESYDNNEPIKNGIVDARLGTTDLHRDCDTCGLNSSECPGHYGHTELADPVFHFGFLDTVKNILSCVCLKCSKLLINKEDKNIDEMLKNRFGKNRFNEIKRITSNATYCQRSDYNCGAAVPKIKKETKNTGLIQLVAEYVLGQQNTEENIESQENDFTKKKIKEILHPYLVFDILRNISDTDCRILGLDPSKSRPENLIIKNFPIPPIAIRPSVKADYLSAGSAEDDLTKKIADIIKQNLRIRKQKDKESSGEETKFIQDHLQLLQYHVAVYFNNESVSLPKSEQKSGGRPIKSISERLQGKQGRIRNNLEGKRTNFCARSVISSDPNISLDELGVPIKIAMTLTFPEVVTPFNIEKLSALVRNGRDKYPGANYVWPAKNLESGKSFPIDLRYRKKTIKLHYNDIVERHIVNGDPVLFNRQPTLHKMSMMCHRIKVIPNDDLSTFRLNVSVTKPYNADFDGDEMNMFLPQTIQSQLELANIADVKKQIISPCYSAPIIQFKQDTPAGIFLLTEKKKIIDWHDAMNLTMYLYDFDQTKVGKKDITSHQLFSYIIPPMINYSDYSDGKKILDINNGELLEGKMTGKILTDQMITFIWDRYGPYKTKIFIDNAQRLATNYLLNHGFTVGFKDALAQPEFKSKILDLMYQKETEATHLLTEIENNPDLLDPETFEKSLFSNLQTVKPDVGAMTMKVLDSTNNFYVMISAKAKGDAVNIGEIMSAKGQEILQYQRVQKTVNGRTLPHFYQNDDSAEGRGFIKNAYIDGLTPGEFWFHHQTGREGLINTAVKTAETGYQQRKMIKAMEDIMVTYDGTIRTGNNIILQLLYGDNQLDQTMQKSIKLTLLSMGNNKLEEKFIFSKEEIKTLIKNSNIYKADEKKFIESNDKYFTDLKKYRDDLRYIQMKARVNYADLKETYFQPINYVRIINDIKNLSNSDEEILSPLYILDQIEFILEHNNTPLIYYKDKKVHPVKAENENKYKFIFRIALMEYLAPKRCIIEYNLNKTKFDMIVKEIIESFNKTLINPGEMVGIIASQSMGEPLTQMTLSSFHKTGSGVAGLQGTPRIRELLGYTKNIATPIMFIYMKNEFKENKSLVYKIASNLRYTLMKDIVKKIDIIYDPTNIYSEKDNMDVNSLFSISGKQKRDIELMPWLYRIFINREKLLDYDINMLDIKTKFIQYWMNKYGDLTNLNKKIKDYIIKVLHCCIITNFNNSEVPIVHIRFEFNNIDNKTLIEFQDIIINKFNLKGDELIRKLDSIEYDSNLSFDNENAELEVKKEYVIYAAGINYNKIRNIPYIDQNKTFCNDIDTIYRLYGIETARAALVREIQSVFSNGGSNINYHHLAIVTDLMTNTGVITSIDRHGVNKLETDPLSRSSFEKTIEILVNAAIFNETDHMKSVSSRIMAGKVFRGGTGLCDILLDNEILENSEFNEYKVIKDETDFIKLTSNNLIDDILKRENIDDLYVPNF